MWGGRIDCRWSYQLTRFWLVYKLGWHFPQFCIFFCLRNENFCGGKKKGVCCSFLFHIFHFTGYNYRQTKENIFWRNVYRCHYPKKHYIISSLGAIKHKPSLWRPYIFELANERELIRQKVCRCHYPKKPYIISNSGEMRHQPNLRSP